MQKFRFYYDESEHSRKINLDTVNAENYYDNFVAVIAGWELEKETEILEKYITFEEKYSDRKSKGELKSQTLKQSQFKNGFASFNRSNIRFLSDFLSLLDDNIYIYFAVISKIEFIVLQIFDGYKNSIKNNIFYDMDSMKYTIIKSILMYQPKEIIENVFENTGELIAAMKMFFEERIEKNEQNPSLKQKETCAFHQILTILNDVHNIKSIDWCYDTAFIGFQKYLLECSIDDYTLTIDREGEDSNTLKAAKQCGLIDAIEEDSKLSVGIRISDMLAGVLSKLLKSLHNALRYNQLDNPLQKKLLNKEWFQLNKEQLMLYKKLHLIICKLNNVWYKAFSGIYSDDLILLNSLLNYMEHFSSVDEIYKQLDMQGEYFNGYVCQCLSDYFDRLHHKHPIKPVYSSKDYFFNKRGAKVFFDIKRQPLLEITTETRKYNVLSVGFGDEGTPLVTIAEYGEVNCYRLPDCLSEWVMTIVSMANMGITVFPSNVLFTKCDGEYYADIL